MKTKTTRKSLVILATTFPRWKNDSLPAFVLDFAQSLKSSFKKVTVIVPHYKGAALKENFDGVRVKRFRYALPYSAENLVYEGHATKGVKKSPTYAVKLILLLVSDFFVTLKTSMFRKTIINAHWVVPQGMVAVFAGFMTRSPVVITVHGGDVFALNGKYMRKIKRWIFKKADRVVVNSSATLEACKDIYDGREYKVIPMGIDDTIFKYGDKRTENKTLQVLFVGRVSKEKGLNYLCEAISMFRGSSVHLTVVGDGTQMPEVVDYIKANKLEKTITLKGWQPHDELYKFYHAADVFVGPSIEDDSGWKEALGLTFAEASACGLPVVATNTGGIKDIVLNGRTGFLVKQKSARVIYEKLLLLQKDPALRLRLGVAGNKHVMANFTWDAVARQYNEVFKRL